MHDGPGALILADSAPDHFRFLAYVGISNRPGNNANASWGRPSMHEENVRGEMNSSGLQAKKPPVKIRQHDIARPVGMALKVLGATPVGRLKPIDLTRCQAPEDIRAARTSSAQPMSSLLKALNEPDIYTTPADRERAIMLRWVLRSQSAKVISRGSARVAISDRHGACRNLQRSTGA